MDRLEYQSMGSRGPGYSMSMRIALLIALLVGTSYAATYTATTCNEYTNLAGNSGTFGSPDPGSVMGTYATEQGSAADGDIISIPAKTTDNCNWDTFWAFSPTNSLTFKGAGAISATAGGATTTGTDQTIITNTTSSGSMIQITTAANKTYRITGIAFVRTAAASTNGAIEITGPSTSVRFDHNHLNSTTTGFRMVYITGSVQGVADHNAIDQYNVNNPFAIENGRTWQGDTSTFGDKSWADGAHWGSSQFFFIEDNWFNQNGTSGNYFNDCSVGGREVIRHNTGVALGAIQAHELTGNSRGCREGEIYLNTFNNGVTEAGSVVGTRSGTVLVWGNTIQNTKNIVAPFQDRTNNNASGVGEPNSSWIKVPNSYSACGNGSTNNGYVGVVSTSGTAVTLVSGNSTWDTVLGQQPINFPNGTSPAAWPSSQWNPNININGTNYVVSSITDNTHLVLTTSAGTQTNVPYFVSSVWDGNLDSTGWPCLDMPGRGAGDLLVGDFTLGTRKDNSTGTPTWPNEIVDPIYVWNNTNTWPGDASVVGLFAQDNIFHDNRDYYQQMATYCAGPTHNACGEWYSGCTLSGAGQSCSFRGSEGIGQGTLSGAAAIQSAFPTCTAGPGGNTPGVGYWSTADNALYVCNPTNTWALYYTPYTYPHPLTQGSAQPFITNGKITTSGRITTP